MSKNWTSLPKHLGKCKTLKNMMQGIAILLCCFALSACGPVSSLWNSNKAPENRQNQTSSAAPATSTAEQKTLEPLPAITMPPGSLTTPLMPGQSGTQYRSDGLPALQPTKGVNLETLFAQEIRDPDLRMERVENAVLDIRKELDAAMPSIVRLVSVERDIQSLVEQLEILLKNEPPAPAQETSSWQPQMQQNASPQAYSPPAASAEMKTATYSAVPIVNTANTPITGQFDVQNIRFGKHKTKTRIVMDVTGKPAFSVDLDNSENLLVIEVKNAGWATALSKKLKKAKLINSYSVYPINGSGSRIVMQLKHSANIIYQGTYTPNKDSRYHRLVIDLMSPSVHK
jgi:hypothetical protein